MAQAKGSKARILGGVKESVYNTTPNIAGGSTINLPFMSSSIRGSSNLIKSKVLKGRRDDVAPSQGNISVAGTVVIPVDQANIGYWLQMLLGNPVSTGNSAPYTHVFDIPDSLDSWVLEHGYTDNGDYQLFNGCKAKSMSFEFGGDGELSASVEIVGGKETTGTSSMDSGTPTSVTLTPYSFKHVAAKEGGSPIATLLSASLTISNELDESQYLIGASGYRGSLPEGKCVVSGNIKAIFEDWTLYGKASAGTESSLQFTLTNGSYSLDILMQEVIFGQNAPAIDTPGGIYIDLPFQAYFDNAAQDKTGVQVTLVNTLAAYIS